MVVWLVVWNMFFPIDWEFHHPDFHVLQRGGPTTNQYYKVPLSLGCLPVYHCHGYLQGLRWPSMLNQFQPEFKQNHTQILVYPSI